MLRKIVEYLYLRKGDENLDFVMSLLNRYDKGGFILDAAVEKGDEMLVVKLAQQYNGNMDFGSFKNVMDFLKASNSTQYNTMFDLLSTKVTNKEEMLDYAIENNQKSIAKEIVKNMELNIDDKDMIAKLASLNDKEISSKILLLLGEIELDVPNKPKLGKTFFNGTGYSSSEFERNVRDYTKQAQRCNNYCKMILSIAINSKNKYLAENVLTHLRTTISIVDEGWVTNERYFYNVKEDVSNKNEIRDIYKEAVNRGAFR